MKSIRILIVIIFVCNSMLFALSNNILADKYLISAKKSIKNKNYNKAITYFEKIFALGVKIPNDIYYFYAKTLNNNNQLEKSSKNFNLYIEKTGRNSKHYQEALGYIVEIEDTIIKNKEIEKLQIQQEKKRKIRQEKEKREKIKRNKERKKREKRRRKEKCASYNAKWKAANYMDQKGCGKRSNYFTGYVDNKCYDKAYRDMKKYSKLAEKYCDNW